MSSPLSMIMPQSSGCLFISLSVVLLMTLPYCLTGRWGTVSEVVKGLSKWLPNWVVFISGGVLWGALSLLMMISLVPFGVMGFHLPILGVGISVSVWVTFTCISVWYRSYQYKSELLSDSSLGVGWVMMSILVETISRLVRAVTLGARISVNIMMGSILHCVVGSSGSSWGLMGLCVLEVGVVIVQTYVLILLVCLYSQELE